MHKKDHWFYSFVLIIGISVLVTPVFGEVTNLTSDSNSYEFGDQIKFQGSVEKEDLELVTIVIKDPDDKFILLVQTIPNINSNFEKSIKISDNFVKSGTYNAVGFISNMTGVLQPNSI